MKKIMTLALISLLFIGCGADKTESLNVIFIVPDGLSSGMWSVVRAVSVGYKGRTNLDRLPHTAVFTTYAADSWITDSAASMTAMMTGKKTNNGVINQSGIAVYKKSPGAPLESLMEYAAAKGMAAGLVTTSVVYDATPAACYAHHYNRSDYSEIASQLVDGVFTPDIILGGGREYMRPNTYLDPETGDYCARDDGRDLAYEMQGAGYVHFESLAEFHEWNPKSQQKALGLFSFEEMRYELDRADDSLGEPPLWEMTAKALAALEDSPRGFFLMVEAARIDHAAHNNDGDRLLFDCIAFDKTVGVALKFLKRNPNTLVLIAADHGCGGATGIGVKVSDDSIAVLGKPGPYKDADYDGFPDKLEVQNPVVLGWSSTPASLNRKPGDSSYKGSHTSEDCIAYAAGSGTEMVEGTLDNTDLYRIMKAVIDGKVKRR